MSHIWKFPTNCIFHELNHIFLTYTIFYFLSFFFLSGKECKFNLILCGHILILWMIVTTGGLIAKKFQMVEFRKIFEIVPSSFDYLLHFYKADNSNCFNIKYLVLNNLFSSNHVVLSWESLCARRSRNSFDFSFL